MEQISNRPVAPSAMRMAISFASDPVTAKLVIFSSPGRVVASSSANSIAQGLLYQEDWWVNRSAMLLIVSTSSGCACPKVSDIMPELMS